jgi:hypothetical protein
MWGATKEGADMTATELTSFLFRHWVKIHARPLTLTQLRPLWREAHRFASSPIPKITLV